MTGRRLNGEGSVYQRASDGRWVGAITLGFNDAGRPVRKTVSAKAADEAKKKLRAVQRQVDDGLPAPDDRMTVKQLLARWENEVLRHQVATNAFDNYKSIADHHLVPTLGSKRVSKLTPADVDALTSAKLDSGLSASTVRRMRAVLSQALDQAVRWGVVARNVVSLTKGPKMKRKEGRGLTPAQAKLLLKSVRGYRLEALYITLLYLDCAQVRPSGCAGPAWTLPRER